MNTYTALVPLVYTTYNEYHTALLCAPPTVRATSCLHNLFKTIGDTDNNVCCRFMEPGVIIMLGGVLPFGSIFIEMYFIFTSFWAYKIYFVYGFMLLVFVILMMVTVCVTVVCTYFLLNAEVSAPVWPCYSFADRSTCSGLPLAVDQLPQRRVCGRLRIPLLFLLFLLQDKDVWGVPDHFLLWLHGIARHGPGGYVW